MSGQHDHRQIGIAGLDRFQRLNAVHARHDHVEHDHVHPAALDALEAGLPILGGFRQMPLFFQNRLHQATLGRIVIDDQYGLGHHTHAFSVAYLFGAIL